MTRRLLLTLLVVGVAGAFGATATYSAFSQATASPSNKLDAGSVAVSDGHTATTPISIADLRPGTTIEGCIKVTYDGSLPADLRQYATTSGALVPYIQVKITRGNGLSGAWPSCTGFTADTANYIGQGNGVIFNGALTSFPTSWGAAPLDPTNGAPETWTSAESHAYRYEISLTNTAAAQGLSGSLTLNWQGQNQ